MMNLLRIIGLSRNSVFVVWMDGINMKPSNVVKVTGAMLVVTGLIQGVKLSSTVLDTVDDIMHPRPSVEEILNDDTDVNNHDVSDHSSKSKSVSEILMSLHYGPVMDW